jgi:hypothetical protein
MNYEMATEAACKYLKEGKDRFGNWTMAAASFNMGMDGLDKVSRIQGTKNYFHLYLNKETSRYIYRILAIKEILNNPTKYGFFLESDDLYSSNDYKTITVDSSIHNLPEFAKSHGTSYKILRVMNPWMIGYSLTNNNGRKFEFKIPVD